MTDPAKQLAIANCPYNKQSCIFAEVRACEVVNQWYKDHSANHVAGVEYITLAKRQ